MTTETALLSPSAREFDKICRFAYDRFGLDLGKGKEQLVSARLGKLMRQLNIATFSEYLKYVESDASGEAITQMIDSLTTNHTSFYREPAHFDLLCKTVLPALRNADSINIWSAACSSGEEPYTLAFCLLAELGMTARFKTRILATDISTRVLEKARLGVYPASGFQVFPPDWLRKFLLRGKGRWQGHYKVNKEVASCIEFQQVNLMEDFSKIGKFDVIFCRNVMIYFDKPTQERLVNKLADRLNPGGYLMIGHSETLNAIQQPLKYVQPAAYRKV
jgi:chemotaxis protein methyltransferase CheR